MSALELVTASWGVAMAASPALQIRAMLATHSSQDVSIGYFIVLSIGFALWIAYGLSTGAAIVWICNVVALVFGLLTVVVALRLRSRAPG